MESGKSFGAGTSKLLNQPQTIVKPVVPLRGPKGSPGAPGDIGTHLSQFNHGFLHASDSDNQDISGKVDKITGYSLVNNNDISKIHTPASDNQDLSNLVVKETGKSLVADSEIAKIHASGSDNQDLSSYVLTNDARLSDARTSTPHGHAQSDITNLATALSGKEPANSNIQIHVTAAHAPSGAQINADITKAEIEAKLTGAISTHSHSGGADPFTAKLVLGADKTTGANTTPITLGLSFNYEANSKYVIDIYAIVAPTAATTGCGFLIDVSTAVTYVGTFISHQLAITGTISGGGSIGDLGATSQGVSSGMVGTNSNFVYGGGILITAANTGTATFFFRSETTAVTTCKSNSLFRIMKMA